MVTAAAVGTTLPQRPLRWSTDFIDASAWSEIESYSEARYVECRLQAGREEVDYLLAFRRSAAEAVRRHLVRALGLADASERPTWQRVATLFHAWSDGVSRLSLAAPDVWLEFDDVAGERNEARLPSVSVCLTPSYRAQRAVVRSDPVRELALIDEILALLGVPVTAAERARLEHCFHELPSGTRFIHFSVMLGRASGALKLYGVAPRSELLPFLDRVGWAGDQAELARCVEELYPRDLLGELVFFDLNLSTLRETTTSTLGLAVAAQHLVDSPDRDPLRTAVLSRWCRAGIASREKSELVRGLLEGGSGAPAAMRSGRFLDLKLVWQAAEPPLAKAYIGFHRQPVELPWHRRGT